MSARPVPPPVDLDDDARRTFRRVQRELRARGTWRKYDAALVAGYARAVSASDLRLALELAHALAITPADRSKHSPPTGASNRETMTMHDPNLEAERAADADALARAVNAARGDERLPVGTQPAASGAATAGAADETAAIDDRLVTRIVDELEARAGVRARQATDGEAA